LISFRFADKLRIGGTKQNCGPNQYWLKVPHTPVLFFPFFPFFFLFSLFIPHPPPPQPRFFLSAKIQTKKRLFFSIHERRQPPRLLSVAMEEENSYDADASIARLKINGKYQQTVGKSITRVPRFIT
jgi:hypothetical protein